MVPWCSTLGESGQARDGHFRCNMTTMIHPHRNVTKQLRCEGNASVGVQRFYPATSKADWRLVHSAQPATCHRRGGSSERGLSSKTRTLTIPARRQSSEGDEI